MVNREFSSLDIRQTIQQCFKGWSKTVPCRNILWITRETFERLAVTDPQAWRWTIDAEQGVETMKPVSLARLFNEWKTVSRVPQLKDLRGPQFITQDSGPCILAPLSGPQSKAVIGYFLFEDVKLRPGSKKLRWLNSELKGCSRHIEFCWQYLRARAQSYVDDLTSLYNQRYLPLVFEREIAGWKE